jgi:hypothetical protein
LPLEPAKTRLSIRLFFCISVRRAVQRPVDLLILITDGVRPVPGIFIVAAGFLAGVGALWLGEEIAPSIARSP